MGIFPNLRPSAVVKAVAERPQTTAKAPTTAAETRFRSPDRLSTSADAGDSGARVRERVASFVRDNGLGAESKTQIARYAKVAKAQVHAEDLTAKVNDRMRRPLGSRSTESVHDSAGSVPSREVKRTDSAASITSKPALTAAPPMRSLSPPQTAALQKSKAALGSAGAALSKAAANAEKLATKHEAAAAEARDRAKTRLGAGDKAGALRMLKQEKQYLALAEKARTPAVGMAQNAARLQRTAEA